MHLDKKTEILLEKFIKKNSDFSKDFFYQKNNLTTLTILSHSTTFIDFLFKNFGKLYSLLKIKKENFTQYQKRIDRLKSKILHKSLSQDSRQLKKNLRFLKYREMINIFVNDASKQDDFPTTVKKISYLAETCISLAFKANELDKTLSIIAMGKLGGEELNYSSDVDLFFILNQNRGNLSKEIVKKIQNFIDLLHHFDENGFVFRVDLSIRPEGNSGPLYSSWDNVKSYFQKRAKEWEFQALIKGRFLLGSKEIKKEFDAFKKKMIYQEKNLKAKKYLENIRRMKMKIEENIPLRKIQSFSSKGFNLKLGSGGIRDIEFFIQFLQLQHGHFSPVLNTTNTLQAIIKLKNLKVIEEKEAEELEKNYIFLRELEHYLQVESFLAIKNFPETQAGEEKLVHILNYNPHNHYDPTSLKAKLNQVIQENKNIFYKLFHLTIKFIAKIEGLLKEIGEEPEQVNQLTEFESDYFINFSQNAILNHLHLLSELKVEKEKIAMIELRRRQHFYVLDIITFDVLGAFPVICGLVATFGLSIHSGSSYLFTPVKNNKWSIAKNQISLGRFKMIKNSNYPQVVKDIKNKKIICSLECFFISPEFEKKFFLKNFTQKINEYFHLLKTQKSQIVLEKLFLETMELNNYKNPNYFKPIFIDVDNQFHPFYTVLHIRSEDTFLFLFQFTKSFIFQEIYIVQVKIETSANEIRNSFYLTNHQGEKIIQSEKIWQLKKFLNLIMYFSFYMVKAPNPFLALTQFTKFINFFKGDYNKLVKNFIDKKNVFHNLIKALGTHENIFENFLSINYDSLNPLKKITNTKLNLESDYKNHEKETHLSKPEEILNRYKDDMLFQLEMNFLRQKGEKKFENFCRQLSDLADFIITKSFHIALTKLKEKPAFSDVGEFDFAIIGLGKWGGQELGYASDIEILFVYENLWQEDNKNKLANFCNQLMQEIRRIIKAKKDGIFEVDFNLRPEGSGSTNLAVPFEKFKNYYSFTSGYLSRAINFERMSFVKKRIIISSNKKFSQKVTKSINDFVYHQQVFDFKEMAELREKQIKQWCPKNKINLKFSLGGLVDIEYLVASFSIFYGRENPLVREANVLKNLKLLYQEGYIYEQEYSELNKRYIFIRDIINALRSVRGNARDLILPENNSLEMEYLNRRLKDFNIVTQQNLFLQIIRTMEKNQVLVKKLLTRLMEKSYR